MKKVYLMILLGIAILSHFEWFNPNSILSYSDWNYWTNESILELWKTWGAWLSFTDFGSVNIQIFFLFFKSIWGLIASIGGTYDLATKITFMIPIAILGAVSPYYLAFRLTNNRLAAFCGALFYSTTTYFLILQTAHLPIAFVYALAPLILAIFDKAMESGQSIYWLLFLGLFILGSFYEIRIMYILVFVLILMTIIIHSSNFKKNFFQLVNFGLLFVLISAFWILPIIFGGASKDIINTANRGLFGNKLFNLNYSLTIFESSWTDSYPNMNFEPQPIPLRFWIIPLLVAISIYLNFRSPNKRLPLFFLTTAFFGVLLAKQDNWPGAGLYSFLYNNFPGFNLFREASKFYLLTSLGYFGLIVLLFNKIKSNHIQQALGIVIIGLSLMNLHPLITGKVKTLFISREIPTDYTVFNKIIDNDEEIFKTLWFPTYSRWATFSTMHQKVGAVQLVENNSKGIFSDSRYSINAGCEDARLQSMIESPYFHSLINTGSIKFVVVPNQDTANDEDIFCGQESSNVRKWYINQLDTLPWLKKLNIGTNNLTVYKNQEYKPYIFSIKTLYDFDSFNDLELKYEKIAEFEDEFLFIIPSTQKVTNNLVSVRKFDNDVIEIKQNEFTQSFSKPKSVSFNIISPAKKHIQIKEASTPFFLTMSENYHDGWQLQLKNDKVQGWFNRWWPFAKPDRVLNEYHYKINGFLNGWYVDPFVLCNNTSSQTACTRNADDSYNIEMIIEFWPERWFYFGLLISSVTLAGCFCYLIILKVRTKEH